MRRGALPVASPVSVERGTASLTQSSLPASCSFCSALVVISL